MDLALEFVERWHPPGVPTPTDPVRAGLAQRQVEATTCSRVMCAERRRAGLPHDLHEFAVQDVDDRLDAALAEGGESPDLRPADTDRGRAEGERLEDVRAAPHAAVDQHRHAPADRSGDLGQAIERRAKRLLVAAAVVRDDDAVDAVGHGERGVLAGDHSLDEQLGR